MSYSNGWPTQSVFLIIVVTLVNIEMSEIQSDGIVVITQTSVPAQGIGVVFEIVSGTTKGSNARLGGMAGPSNDGQATTSQYPNMKMSVGHGIHSQVER